MPTIRATRPVMPGYGLPSGERGLRPWSWAEEILREGIKAKFPVAMRAKELMDRGELVDDATMIAIVRERLLRPDAQCGFVLDGFPRTVPQAEYLDGLLKSLGRKLDRVISYEVAEEMVVERISGRRSCAKCGAVYHVTQNPPKKTGVCDKEGSDLVQRPDDKPENVRVRLAEYGAKTEPLKRYYREKGSLSEVDGVGSTEGILAATLKVLGK